MWNLYHILTSSNIKELLNIGTGQYWVLLL